MRWKLKIIILIVILIVVAYLFYIISGISGRVIESVKKIFDLGAVLLR